MYRSNLILPRCGILSYEDAVQKHDSIAPIRGRSTDVRPLAKRRNDNLTIRRLHDSSIAVRLYHTDIVVYRPDGTIELEPYGSMLTNDAVRTILGRAVTPQYTHPAGPVLWVKSKGYRIPDHAVLDKDLNLISGSAPFTLYRVDKTKARQAAQTSGFNQFSLWLKTQLRIGIDPRQGARWGGLDITTSMVRSLDEPDRYGDIVRDWPAYQHINDQLLRLRREVYRYYDCITEAELPFVEDWRELQSVRSSQMRLR